MSLVYRAIWQDERDELCASAFGEFKKWVEVDKVYSAFEVPDLGKATATVHRSQIDVQCDVSVEQASSPDGLISVLRASLTESSSDGNRWQTTLRVWDVGTEESAHRESYIWIDVAAVGDGVDLRSLSPAAPKLARSLLSTSASPKVGTLPLSGDVQYFSGDTDGEQLAGIVSDFDRTLPIVVFAQDDLRFAAIAGSTYEFAELVQRAANQVAGIARIAIADKAAAGALTEALGEGHGVWDGAFRVYLKELDPAARNDGWRHRYITADRYMGYKSSAATIIGRMLGLNSVTRRPPKSFDRAKKLLDDLRRAGTDDLDQFIDYANDELEKRDRELIDLRERVNSLQQQLDHAILDRQMALEEGAERIEMVESVSRRLQHVLKRLAEAGKADDYFESAASTAASTPVKASSTSDAIAKAREYLSDRLIIPHTAPKGIEVLDSDESAVPWGQYTWQGLRALHAYVCVLAENPTETTSFFLWCKNSGHPLVWATNKLAMKESTTVENNTKMRRDRTFDVDTEVDPSGSIYMESHLKIQIGGGLHIPRVYFHVDPINAKVHIGLIGPHYLVPNTQR